MSLVDTFKEDPTKRSNLHKLYQDSMFVTQAPEYSTSEVLMGSAYRRLLLGITDKDVDLLNISWLEGEIGKQLANAGLASRIFSTKRGLGSPLRSGQQGSIALRQLMPLVPEIARNACVLGKVRNRWFPGNLFVEAIAAALGPEALPLLTGFTKALTVSSSDDLVAQFVQQLLIKAEAKDTKKPKEAQEPQITAEEMRSYRGKSTDASCSPAERFCRDLNATLQLKDRLTRRQWTVLIEAVLRLGLPTHVLWVCRANSVFWEMCLSVCTGNEVPSEEDVDRRLWSTGLQGSDALEVGRDAMPALKTILQAYLYARFGLNLMLARLDDAGKPWSNILGYEFGNTSLTAASLRNFLVHLSANRLAIHSNDPVLWLVNQCSDLLDKRTSLVRCTAGFTKNMLEFIRHGLGQIEAQDPESSSYDQSYFLTNETRGRARSSQWPVQLGPAMLIVLAHACSNDQGDIPVSVEDFRTHLNSYGIGTPAGELATGRTGKDLQNLGLIVDSPDAAGGRLLVRPF
jgi:hypothetical protein